MAIRDQIGRLCRVVLTAAALFGLNLAAVAIVLVCFNRPPDVWDDFVNGKENIRRNFAMGHESHREPHAWMVVKLVSAKGQAVVPILEDLLWDRNPQVRQLAPICLGNIGGKDSVYPLRSALDDWENFPHRMEILFALAQLSDAFALAPLRAYWDDEEAPPYQMIEAMAMLGDYSRVPVLLAGLGKWEDRKPYEAPFREYAPENVLERISGEHFGDDVEKWRAWYEKKIKTTPPPDVPEKEIKKWKDIFSRNGEQYWKALEKHKRKHQAED